MTPRDFAVGLMHSVVDEGVRAYEDMFNEAYPEKSSDPYGKQALTLFHSLTQEQKFIFFKIVRQVSVDTVSSVLGIIDGVGFIEGATEEYTLIYGRDQKLSGDLQSLFLVEQERATK